MREAAALERDDPGSDVMPDSRHAPIISHVVVGRRRVLGVDVDMKKSAMPAEASGEGSEEEWVDVEMGERQGPGLTQGQQARVHDEGIKISEGGIA